MAVHMEMPVVRRNPMCREHLLQHHINRSGSGGGVLQTGRSRPIETFLRTNGSR